jgi:nitroimidazol reductase NimA-like FMN-containing flavoprotein (pyridoxamine 5'-phosphate oxidase superfamily)
VDSMHAQSGLAILPRQECLGLLAGQHVGRLGFVVDDQPVVLPVNYALHGGVVVFRTGDGAKLRSAVGSKVAFEVDNIDAGTGSGWSVLIQGVAEDITDSDDWFVESLRRGAAPTWMPGPADHFVSITPQLISGRRLPPLSTAC